jgi:hypothetical protein
VFSANELPLYTVAADPSRPTLYVPAICSAGPCGNLTSTLARLPWSCEFTPYTLIPFPVLVQCQNGLEFHPTRQDAPKKEMLAVEPSTEAQLYM